MSESDPKITFHAPVPRDPTSAREIIPVPSSSVQVSRARSGPRPSGAAGQGGGSQFALHALRRWWKIAFPVGLLLACGAVAMVYALFEPKYEASALLEINERAPFIAYEPKEGGISKGYFRTQMEIIKSRWILGRTVAAIEKIKEMPEIFKQRDKIDWLKKQVTVMSANDSDVFEIKYSSSDPENAALVVNTVTEQYLKAQEEEETKRNSTIVAALAKQIYSREEDVRALRKQVQTATHQLPSKEPEFLRPEQNSQAKTPLGEMQSRLIDVQVQSSMLRAQITATEEELAAAEKAEQADSVKRAAQNDAASKASKATQSTEMALPAKLSEKQIELRNGMVAREIANSLEVRRLASQLSANRAELERILKVSKQGNADPLCIRQKEEIAIVEKKLNELKQTLAKAIENDTSIKLAATRLSKQEIDLCEAIVRRAVAENMEVRQLNSQIMGNQMELDRTEKRSKLGTADPLYVRRQEEIAILERQLDEIKKNMAEPIRTETVFSLQAKHGGDSGIGPNSEITVFARRREELARMRSALRSYEIAEIDLRKACREQTDKFLKELEALSEDNLNLTFKRDELAEKQAVLAKITERQIAMQTESSAPARVIWHEPAKAPEAPVEVLPYRNMALAGLLGFCLPFALAVGWEGMARRISGSEDLEHQLHLSVLGEISRLPTRNRAVSGPTGTPISVDLRVFQESVDNLRLALTLGDDLHDMRILAVTSAVNHEGKTSVASQLALSLARATGKTTLLIDGDMRSPDVHQVFGVPQGPGLAEVLSDECPLADAIVATHNEHVHVLPAGEIKVSPHQLLGNGSWKSLLEQIPNSYGYVIIDTPPVLAASEALVLAKAADATLLCVMRDVSRADQVRKAAERLLTAGGRPVGTVLSGVPMSRYKYGYGIYPSPSHS